MNTGAILQARINSSRLPGKVLLRLPFKGEKNILEHIKDRVSRSRKIDIFLVATTVNSDDDEIAGSYSGEIFRGDESNVLRRYYHAAKEHGIDTIVRLTGDNPCIDGHHIDLAVEKHVSENLDYTETYGLPLGTNIQVISFGALEAAYRESRDTYEQEHVAPFIIRQPGRFKTGKLLIQCPDSVRQLRLTIDYPSDYAMMSMLFEYFNDNHFTLDDVAGLVSTYNWLPEINRNHQKTEFKSEREELNEAYEILRKYEMNIAADIIEHRMVNEL